MKTSSNMEKYSYSASKSFYFVILMLAFSSIPFSSSSAADRFAPPSFNKALDDFNSRSAASDSINVDFIVAQVLNNARQIERAGERFKSDALLFKNKNNQNTNNNTGFGASSNSVIIPPGTKAGTIIIINQNDGDSYAIER